MADHHSQDRHEWLLQIGQRLRFQYADIIAAAPLPERLAALLRQLEEAVENPRQAA
jgi:anti-sigma factor NepR-like protein